MKRHYLFLILLFSLFLSGCKLKNNIQNAEEDKALAHECLSLLRAGDINDIEKLLDPQLIEKLGTVNLTTISQALNHSELLSEDFVGLSALFTKDKHVIQTIYQYHFKDSWILASISTEKTGQNRKIIGINLSPISKSLQETNAFVFTGKSIFNYIIMSIAVINPILIIIAFVICIMTKIQKRKWLWIAFIIFGIGHIALNWTTGQIAINPLYIMLLGSSYSKMSQFTPLIINISLPLGAIIFLIKRKKLKAVEPETLKQEIISPFNYQDISKPPLE